MSEKRRKIEKHIDRIDPYGQAASAVLDRSDSFETRTVDLDAEFPLDDGENAAITISNELDAVIFLCDEFNQVGLLHATLADTGLVTTPALLSKRPSRQDHGRKTA